MTIDLKNIIGNLGRETLTPDDSQKFTSTDFSAITEQFSNIFDKHFLQQFDYKNLFEAPTTNQSFMSSAVASFTNNNINQDFTTNPNFQTDYNNSNNPASQELKSNNEYSNNDWNQESAYAQNELSLEKSNEKSSEQKTAPTDNLRNQEESSTKDLNCNKNVANTSEAVQKEMSNNQATEKKTQDDATPKKEVKSSTEQNETKEEQTKVVAAQIVAEQPVETTKLVKKPTVETTLEGKAQGTIDTPVKEIQGKTAEVTTEKKGEIQLKVSADSEIKPDEKIAAINSENKPELKKDIKIEAQKIEIKTEGSTETKTELPKNTTQEVQEKTQQAVSNKSEAIQNKVSMERIAANIDTKEIAPEADGEIKTKAKNTEESLSSKITEKMTEKAQGMPQNISQNAKDNSNFANGQQFQNQQLTQQENQELKVTQNNTNNVHFDATLAKSTIRQSGAQLAKPVSNPVPNQAMEKDITNQVMKNIRGNVSAEKANITMILKPESLGKVTINILNQRGIMTTEIKAETQQAADSLNKNINDLKSTLKEQGVIFDNLVVKVENSNKAENNTQFNLNQQNLKDFQEQNTANSNKNSKESQQNENINFNQELLAEEDIQQQEQVIENKGLVDYRV